MYSTYNFKIKIHPTSSLFPSFFHLLPFKNRHTRLNISSSIYIYIYICYRVLVTAHRERIKTNRELDSCVCQIFVFQCTRFPLPLCDRLRRRETFRIPPRNFQLYTYTYVYVYHRISARSSRQTKFCLAQKIPILHGDVAIIIWLSNCCCFNHCGPTPAHELREIVRENEGGRGGETLKDMYIYIYIGCFLIFSSRFYVRFISGNKWEMFLPPWSARISGELGDATNNRYWLYFSRTRQI